MSNVSNLEITEVLVTLENGSLRQEQVERFGVNRDALVAALADELVELTDQGRWYITDAGRIRVSRLRSLFAPAR